MKELRVVTGTMVAASLLAELVMKPVQVQVQVQV